MSMDVLPSVVWPLGCDLGEGPVWRAEEAALWFVDIKRKQIHRWRPQIGDCRTWDAPSAPGFLAPIRGGAWLAGLKSGLHRFDPLIGGFELITEVEDARLGNRLNDGFVDREGRLWFGSMHDPEKDLSGALYRFDARGLKRMDAGYCVTNGPAVSPDGRTFYHTDTLQKVIYAYDLGADGEIADRRVFVRIEPDAGYPDGSAVDAEGCLWTALYCGWAARRYSPKGELLQTVRFPVANVTKIAFGGIDLMTAFAVTASQGLSPADRAAQPHAGDLFAFPLQTPGQAQNELAWPWPAEKPAQQHAGRIEG